LYYQYLVIWELAFGSIPFVGVHQRLLFFSFPLLAMSRHARWDHVTLCITDNRIGKGNIGSLLARSDSVPAKSVGNTLGLLVMVALRIFAEYI